MGGLGAGTMPSARAKRRPAAKHSDWDLATASNMPSSYMCESIGDMP